MVEEAVKHSYFVVIPYAVLSNKELPANAKLVYGEIMALINEKGYCWASNKYISEAIGIGEDRVSDLIGILKKQNLITTKLYKNYKRKIWITEAKIMAYLFTQKQKRGSVKMARGVGGNGEPPSVKMARKSNSKNIDRIEYNNINSFKNNFAKNHTL